MVDRCIAALGGREAMLKIQNTKVTGTIEIEELKMSGTFLIYQARPNKAYVKLDIERMGITERGTDGEVFWERRPSLPLRFLAGKELDIHLLSAYFDETHYDDIFRDVVYEGTESVEGQECYRVVLTSHQSDPVIIYYSKVSGLPMKTELRIHRGAGILTTSEHYSRDFRAIAGVKLAYLLREHAMGIDVVQRVQDIQINIALPEGIFSPPPDGWLDPNDPFGPNDSEQNADI
ncbi:DUF620 domain-containing protein [Planctomycetota bacterium]